MDSSVDMIDSPDNEYGEKLLTGNWVVKSKLWTYFKFLTLNLLKFKLIIIRCISKFEYNFYSFLCEITFWFVCYVEFEFEFE